MVQIHPIVILIFGAVMMWAGYKEGRESKIVEETEKRFKKQENEGREKREKIKN